MKRISLILVTAMAAFAQTAPWEDLVNLARTGPATTGLKDAITKTLGARGGQIVWGQDYLFVTASTSPVTISIDNQPAVALTHVEGSDLWMYETKMRTGVTHPYQYYAAGKPLGNRGDAVG